MSKYYLDLTNFSRKDKVLKKFQDKLGSSMRDILSKGEYTVKSVPEFDDLPPRNSKYVNSVNYSIGSRLGSKRLANHIKGKFDNGQFNVVEGRLNPKKHKPSSLYDELNDFEHELYMDKMGYTPRQKQVLKLMN